MCTILWLPAGSVILIFGQTSLEEYLLVDVTATAWLTGGIGTVVPSPVFCQKAVECAGSIVLKYDTVKINSSYQIYISFPSQTNIGIIKFVALAKASQISTKFHYKFYNSYRVKLQLRRISHRDCSNFPNHGTT